MTKRKQKTPILEELSGPDGFGAVYTSALELQQRVRPPIKAARDMDCALELPKPIIYNSHIREAQSSHDVARACMESSFLGTVMRNIGLEQYSVLLQNKVAGIVEELVGGKFPRRGNLKVACVVNKGENYVDMAARYGKNSSAKRFGFSYER